MFKIIVAYVRGMRELGDTKWKHVVDEWGEFMEDYSWGEFCDVLHVLIRYVTKSSWMGVIVWKTAKKHGERYLEYGSVRSKRHL